MDCMKVPTTATAGQIRSQESGASSGSSTWAQGFKDLDYLLLLSQAYEQGAEVEVEQSELELLSIWDAADTGSGLMYHATMLALVLT